jgi:competence protein ComEC
MPNRSSAAVVIVLALSGAGGIFYIASEAGLLENDANSEMLKNSAESAVPTRRISQSGTVMAVKKMGRGRAALVRTASGRYVLKIWDDGEFQALLPGDYVSFSGFPEYLKRAGKQGGFDEFLYWKAKGASLAISGPEILKIGVSKGFARQRTLLEARIKKSLPPRTAGYLLAALTGTRDESLTSLHRSVGTSHLLAVSGAHVAIVFAVFWFFLRYCRSRLFLVSPIIWAYVILSGAAASAVRAALMIQLAIVGRILGRAGKAFNTVSSAGAIMLLLNPWLFWDVGWRLSVIAVLTLSSLSAQKFPPSAAIFLSSPLVWLATALQSSWTFGSSPIVGIAANFFALPAFAVLFPLAFIFSVPSLTGLPFGSVFASVPEFLFSRWERLSLNLLALCPWELGFSFPLLISCVALLAYLFSSASGFGSSRSLLSAAIITAGFCACVI